MATHRPRKGIELYSEGDRYVVLVDLPGRESGDVTCRLEDGSLSITAPPPTNDSDADPLDRTLGFPRPIRGEHAEAVLEDGVLRVELPTDGGRAGDHTPAGGRVGDGQTVDGQTVDGQTVDVSIDVAD